MKKHNIFKTVLVTILALVVMSWIFKVSEFNGTDLVAGERNQIGVWTLGTYFSGVLSYFGNLAIYVLVVGGFYGIISKLKAYAELQSRIQKKFKKRESKFIILSVITFGLLGSFTGLSLPLLVFVPFMVSIILALGYNKISAFAATVGATLVGVLGSTLGYFMTGYIYTTLALPKYSSLNTNFVLRLFVLVIGLGLLIYHIVSKKNNKTKNEEVSEDPFFDKEDELKGNKMTLPLTIILSITALLVVVGLFPWQEVLNFNFFDKLHKSIMEFEIFEFALFSKLFGSIPALGMWNFEQIEVLLVVVSLLLAWVYGLKLNDIIDGFVKGCKKLFPAAMVVIMINVVLLITVYHPFMNTIYSFIWGMTKQFSTITTALVAFISSIANVDPYYLTMSGQSLSLNTYMFTSAPKESLALIYQFMYGLASLVGPTSLMLFAGLTYLDVPYTKWLSYIFKFILQLLVVIILVLLVVAFIK